jgi:KaiC/GvpD/RAD55 family RecA-like ATPase
MVAKSGSNGKYAITRLSTGILGLDDMLNGGFPEGTQNLIMGEAGSGKTLLAFQILYNAAKAGVPCTFITLDQSEEALIKTFNAAFPELSELDALMDTKMFNFSERIMDTEFKSRENLTLFISQMSSDVRSNYSKLVAIDSLSLLRALLEDNRAFTRMVNSITEEFHNTRVTGLITLEVPAEVTRAPGLYEESMFDGILKLSNTEHAGSTQHNAAILKLRYSKYKSSPMPLEITPEGIVIRAKQATI